MPTMATPHPSALLLHIWISHLTNNIWACIKEIVEAKNPHRPAVPPRSFLHHDDAILAKFGRWFLNSSVHWRLQITSWRLVNDVDTYTRAPWHAQLVTRAFQEAVARSVVLMTCLFLALLLAIPKSLIAYFVKHHVTVWQQRHAFSPLQSPVVILQSVVTGPRLVLLLLVLRIMSSNSAHVEFGFAEFAADLVAR